jgi:hypothetical protein
VLDLVTFSKMWVLPTPPRLRLRADDGEACSPPVKHEVLYGLNLAPYSQGPKPGWRRLVGFYRPGDTGQVQHDVFRFGGGRPTEYEDTREFGGGERLTWSIVADESGQPATEEYLYWESTRDTDGRPPPLSQPEVVKIREALNQRGGRPVVTQEQAALLHQALAQRDGPLLAKHPAQQRPAALERAMTALRTARRGWASTGVVAPFVPRPRDRNSRQCRVVAGP